RDPPPFHRGRPFAGVGCGGLRGVRRGGRAPGPVVPPSAPRCAAAVRRCGCGAFHGGGDGSVGRRSTAALGGRAPRRRPLSSAPRLRTAGGHAVTAWGGAERVSTGAARAPGVWGHASKGRFHTCARCAR